jgi:hypothetical protein
MSRLSVPPPSRPIPPSDAPRAKVAAANPNGKPADGPVISPKQAAASKARSPSPEPVKPADDKVRRLPPHSRSLSDRTVAEGYAHSTALFSSFFFFDFCLCFCFQSKAATIASSSQQEVSNLPVLDMETFEQILELDEDGDREFSSEMVWQYFDQAEQAFHDMDEKLYVLSLSLLCFHAPDPRNSRWGTSPLFSCNHPVRTRI